MKYNILSTAVFAFLIILFSSASAITISPGIVDAGDLDRGRISDYDIYITNQDIEAVSVRHEITPRSMYMTDFVNISPKQITLNPIETKKINIRLNLPNESSQLGNGTHHLTILPNIVTDNGAGVKIVSMPVIELIFTIPGTVTESMSLESFSAPDVKLGDLMTFELLARNTGTVRAKAFSFVEIQRYGLIVGLSEGYTEYIVAKEKQAKMFTKYPTAGMEPGRYRAIAYVEYAGKKKTNTIEKTFNILPAPKENNPPDEKNTATPAQSTPPVPRDYISIGGEKTPVANDPAGIPDITDEPDALTTNTLGEIIAKNLILNQSVNDLAIILEIENTHITGLEYDAVFNIFNGVGKKEGTIITRGYINNLETAEIRKTWNITGNVFGNYTVTADITYEIDSRVKTVKKSSSIEIKAKGNSVTGNILGYTLPENSSAIIALILLISACAIIITSMRMRRQAENTPNGGTKSEKSAPSYVNNSENSRKHLLSSVNNTKPEKENEKTP